MNQKYGLYTDLCMLKICNSTWCCKLSNLIYLGVICFSCMLKKQLFKSSTCFLSQTGIVVEIFPAHRLWTDTSGKSPIPCRQRGGGQSSGKPTVSSSHYFATDFYRMSQFMFTVCTCADKGHWRVCRQAFEIAIDMNEMPSFHEVLSWMCSYVPHAYWNVQVKISCSKFNKSYLCSSSKEWSERWLPNAFDNVKKMSKIVISESAARRLAFPWWLLQLLSMCRLAEFE